mmetsp:Transcript_19707/g.35680  ORF Transcript_19707/g.35680 Transcript_19707/m.35680 type:complete len:217 (+) Transcript_19707:844-1494(+)
MEVTRPLCKRWCQHTTGCRAGCTYASACSATCANSSLGPRWRARQLPFQREHMGHQRLVGPIWCESCTASGCFHKHQCNEKHQPGRTRISSGCHTKPHGPCSTRAGNAGGWMACHGRRACTTAVCQPLCLGAWHSAVHAPTVLCCTGLFERTARPAYGCRDASSSISMHAGKPTREHERAFRDSGSSLESLLVPSSAGVCWRQSRCESCIEPQDLR